MEKIKTKIVKNLTVPNLLSFLRLCVIPPFIIFFLNSEFLWAGIMLLISGLSDMFDGMIARKFNQVTQLGKMLDPVADKLTLIATVICLAIRIPVILPIVIVLFAKDFIMLIGGLILLCKKIKPPAAKWYGKVATAIFYVSIITLVLLEEIFDYHNNLLASILLTATVIAMLFAFVCYARIFINLIKNKDNQAAKDEAENQDRNKSEN